MDEFCVAVTLNWWERSTSDWCCEGSCFLCPTCLFRRVALSPLSFRGQRDRFATGRPTDNRRMGWSLMVGSLWVGR